MKTIYLWVARLLFALCLGMSVFLVLSCPYKMPVFSNPWDPLFDEKQNVTFLATQSTFMPSGWTENYGNYSVIEVGHGARSLIRFDLSAVSRHRRVKEATILLTIRDYNSGIVTGSFSEQIFLHEVLQRWEEGTGQATHTYDGATWNYRYFSEPGNPDSGVPWHTPGCNGVGYDFQDQIAGHQTVTSLNHTYRVPVSVSLVQQWIENPESNFGLLITDQDLGTDRVNFYPREHRDKGPRLEIVYGSVNQPEEVIPMIMQSVQGGSSDSIPNGTQNGTWSVSDFSIGVYPVTQSQYEAVMGHNPSDTSRGIGPNNPVNRVSWYDALVFSNTLSMNEGLVPVYSISGSTNPADWGSVPTSQNSTWDEAVMTMSANGYRLATEAEWEWAARGGVNSKGYTYAGSNTIDEVAWTNENSGGATHPVGQKLPNELGLYDMSGNVWEWNWDWHGGNMSGSDPTGPASGSYRRVRGGSWGDSASGATVSYRRSFIPGSGYGSSGFRLVRRP